MFPLARGPEKHTRGPQAPATQTGMHLRLEAWDRPRDSARMPRVLRSSRTVEVAATAQFTARRRRALAQEEKKVTGGLRVTLNLKTRGWSSERGPFVQDGGLPQVSWLCSCSHISQECPSRLRRPANFHPSIQLFQAPPGTPTKGDCTLPSRFSTRCMELGGLGFASPMLALHYRDVF